MNTKHRFRTILAAVAGITAIGLGLAAAPAQAAPASAFTINLTASASSVLVGQPVNFTATTNIPVNGTGNVITIWAESLGEPDRLLATCNSGTACAATDVYWSEDGANYYAYVAPPSSGVPTNWVAINQTLVGAHWSPIVIEDFTASATTVPAGRGTTLLTTTLYEDPGPTPFWVEVFDVTTRSILVKCKAGTTCLATAAIPIAATEQYTAYVTTDSSGNFPPSGHVEESSKPAYVTWSSAAYQVSLSGPSIVSAPGPTPLTVTTNRNPSLDGYAIEVFDTSTGAYVGGCSSGTTCNVNATESIYGVIDYVAFVAPFGTSLPPANTQASSNVVRVLLRPIP
ncbi:MAG TPA: hypothetical protein VHZ97_03075 [Pseudonocardiaceae bacterium]|nr:hypothetical protein [Pseudonocardiaceae bacterium]